MIGNKKELKFYIMADRIMNGGSLSPGYRDLISNLIMGGGILSFLYYMRKYSYYKNHCQHKPNNFILSVYYYVRFYRLSRKLGFSIGPDVFDYGLCIPHYGTIVVNNEARVGKFAVLHTSTNIAGSKAIGDALYLSTGCQLVGEITLGDNVSVASNSLVNKSFESNCLIGGVPSKVLRDHYSPWYIRDGEKYMHRVNMVEELKKDLGL